MKKSKYKFLLIIFIWFSFHILSHEFNYNTRVIAETQYLILSRNGLEITVNATMYHAVKKQGEGNPLITASGLKINPKTVSKKNYIAISWDLHKRYGGMFEFYDTVYIENAGHKSNERYVIVDLMNQRWKKKIDFLESINTPVYKYTNVKLIAEL